MQACSVHGYLDQQLLGPPPPHLTWNKGPPPAVLMTWILTALTTGAAMENECSACDH